MNAPSQYRRNCLNEHGEQCTICGSTGGVVAHHIDGDRSNNDITNLAPVCGSCHGKIHAENPGYKSWSDKLKDIEGPVGRTMYLGSEVVEEIEVKYEEISPRYRREYDEKLEKNAVFYPALLRAGVRGTSVEEELGLVSQNDTDL